MLINYQSQQVDSSGKGKLDYGEFVAISLHLQRMANDEHLKRAFSYFDKDGNGYIDPQELQEALVEDGAADSADVANDILQEVDTDKVRREYPPTFSTSFPPVLPLMSYAFFLLELTGWTDQLRRVCCDDENWNRLEKSFQTLLKRKVQQSQHQTCEGWVN